MLEFAHIVYEVVIWLFLLYSLTVFIIYAWIGIYAYGAVIKYKHSNIFTDYNLIVTNPNAPRFSLIAPAYNEGMTIVDNVRSLLSLYYHNLEIIIVNDGSKDDSIEKLIQAYDLEKVSFYVQGDLETKAVRGVYKSKNPAFKKLLVVDKENGGKADALNVGVNISSGEYIVCIDVDCILEQDALLKLAKPFLEQSEKRVIACGGVIRLANNCKVENGKITDINLPKTWLGRTQALEYIRAFVLGRMAWSRASGLILISGAFGAFDKEIVLACGGYDKNTVGEDMELVVRMRRYMEEEKLPYEVVNIPDPLCWTEVPESKEVLRKQRNRWMRGTMETLWKHRKLMFNPKYGKLGMVSMPYWFFFEFLGPLVEFFGYIVFIVFFILGIINWPFFFALFTLVIASGILYSIYAVLVDLIGYHVYTKRKDLSKLVGTAILEPFYFHPIVVKAGVQGTIDYFKKQHSWGEMTRQGFQQGAKDEPWYKKLSFYLVQVLNSFAPTAFLFIIFYLITTGIEFWWYGHVFGQLNNSSVALSLFIENVWVAFEIVSVVAILYLLFTLLSKYWADFLLKVTFAVLIILQFILFLYFSESKNLLGADMFYYSLEETKQILNSSGMLSLTNIGLLVLLILAVVTPFRFINRITVKRIYPILSVLILGFISFFISTDLFRTKVNLHDEFALNASLSKVGYFMNSNITNYLENNADLAFLFNVEEDFDESNSYPLLRAEDTKDMLGEYFNESVVTPNLVIVIVEGLGTAYSTPSGYIGSFTPFVDSLRSKSLYWSNNLSTSGRTFSVLPSLLGSLPFGTHGFLEEPAIANHFNLFNIFGYNGFETGFYYGGNSEFDNMKSFIKFSNVDHLVDESSYSSDYKMLPKGTGGESWGFEDQAVFSKYLTDQTSANQPYFNVLLTLSTHNPFLINNVKHSEQLFDKRLKKGDLTSENLKWAKDNRKQLVSVMNFDEALSSFFKSYEKRPDFEHTIFIITGDHAMPEIPLQTKIDRFHVPLIVYSPLLKGPRTFKNTVSHLDIAPSILSYYKNNYGLKTPERVTWIGRGLDEGASSRTSGMAMMQSKNQLIDFVHGNYHFSDDKLYKLDASLNEEPIQDEAQRKLMKQRFDRFKKINKKFIEEKKVMPDSIFNSFFD